MNALASPLPSTPPLSSTLHAAIIVLLLGEEEAAEVLARLEPDELQRLGAAMCTMDDVESANIADAVNGFMVEAARETLPFSDRPARVRGFMAKAVGENKADYLMQRIVPDTSGRPLAIARWLTPEALLELAGDQPPQVIAVLLLLLDSDPAARFLALLPQDLQPQIVERVARVDKVPAQAKDLLNTMLERRMTERVGSAALALGGVREAAEIINRVAGGMDRLVLPAIAQGDAALAGAIENELVTFSMLLQLDQQALGRLLREVDNAMLIDALKGLDEDSREPFFAAMSSRAADGVKDEIELRGRIRRTEVEAAQAGIIALARQLAAAGEITIGAGDSDYV